MIQIINKDTVRLTNSGETITKMHYDELDSLMRDGWYYMALRFVQCAYDAYKGMKQSSDCTSYFDTDCVSMFAPFHYTNAIQGHIMTLVDATVYMTMRDAIGDSLGYDVLSGLATLAWEMEYDDDNREFYHDMLECSVWAD